MQINEVVIDDAFAEAFPMPFSRLIITADTPQLADQAAIAATGLAFSIVGCGCEAGLERAYRSNETPDGRPGRAVILFSTSAKKLAEQLFLRIGQAVLTSATSACFNGMESEQIAHVGGKLRYFGDGYQSSKKLDDHRFWRIPVGDGEFIVDESFGIVQGVGGGNLLLFGGDCPEFIDAAKMAVAAIKEIPGVITPFPGGICRSPSKPGSRYRNVVASTNETLCPTLFSRTESQLTPEISAVYEIVIDGISEDVVKRAMAVGLRAACRPGVIRITAGNYGGKLGPIHLHLHNLLEDWPE